MPRRHLRAALRAAGSYARHPRAAIADRVAWDVAWEDIVGLPVLFTDGDGLRFVLYPRRNEGVYVEHGGNYETGEVALCRRLVQPGMTVLDVGANIGMYTLLLAHLAGEQGTVHAFEPEPSNLDRLRLHLSLNPSAGVTVVAAAVGRTSGTATLHAFDPAYGAWHSLVPQALPDPFHPGQTVRPAQAIEVPLVTLDDHCARSGIARVGLLKLDVEGGEFDVLAGASGLLGDRAIEQILFEVSLPQIEAFGSQPDEIFELLANAGYSARPVAHDGSLGDPVRRAERRYGNYLAEPLT